ncbi:hypothetical protein V6N13_130665 [Hibiscus sabdariffa]
MGKCLMRGHIFCKDKEHDLGRQSGKQGVESNLPHLSKRSYRAHLNLFKTAFGRMKCRIVEMVWIFHGHGP